MTIIDFDLYKPSDIEKWITQQYQQYGILYPSDLTIEAVCELFDIHIVDYEGPCFADWEDGDYSIVFINHQHPHRERRAIFFHELCHPLRHVGQQDKLPQLFRDLQESQAFQFQLISAMPIYLLRQVPLCQYWDDYINDVAHAFELPDDLVEYRIKQVMARIDQERYDQRIRNLFKPKEPVPVTYSEQTMQLLDQLHRQIAKKKSLQSCSYSQNQI